MTTRRPSVRRDVGTCSSIGLLTDAAQRLAASASAGTGDAGAATALKHVLVALGTRVAPPGAARLSISTPAPAQGGAPTGSAYRFGSRSSSRSIRSKNPTKDAKAGAETTRSRSSPVASALAASSLPLFRTVDEMLVTPVLVPAALESTTKPKPAAARKPKATKIKDLLLPYAELQRLPALGALAAFNCHNGQRKLALSLLEFVAEALGRDASDAKKSKSNGAASEAVSDARPPVVVYAGASGLAATVAAAVFPNVRFVLYDRAPNTVQLISPAFMRAMGGAAVVHPVDVKHARPDLQLLQRGGGGGSGSDSGRRFVVYRAWFDDAEARKWAAASASGAFRVLFVSDVRRNETDEPSIARDMVDQMRWAVLCRAEAYMFKFRVPYDWSEPVRAMYASAVPGADAAARSGYLASLQFTKSPPVAVAGRKSSKSESTSTMSSNGATVGGGGGGNSSSGNNGSSSSSGSSKINGRKKAGGGGGGDVMANMAATFAQQRQLPYLDGRLFIQLYGRPTTAELRLIGFATAASGSGGGGSAVGPVTYRWRWYDVPQIEAALATFNAVYRSHARFRHGSHSDAFLKKHRDGAFAGYESVAEFVVASRCSAALGGGQTIDALAATVRQIDRALNEFVPDKTTLKQCVLRAAPRQAGLRHADAAFAQAHLAACASSRV